jgi:hypothetical protein
MAEFTGALVAVLAGGIGTLLIVALWMKLFPTLLNMDDLSHSELDSHDKPRRKPRKLKKIDDDAPRPENSTPRRTASDRRPK